METQDNDFKLMLKRIGITTLVFVLGIVVWYGYESSPSISNKTIITTVQDTITVMTKDALQNRIIISIHYQVNPSKMSSQNNYAYHKDEIKYIKYRSLVKFNDALRNAAHTFIFDKKDSIGNKTLQFRNLIGEAASEVMDKLNNNNFDEGLTIADEWTIIEYDPIIGVLLANEKATIARKRLERLQKIKVN